MLENQIPAVQLLNPEGERVQHDDYDLDLTDEELRGLYRDMVLVRRLDTEATALQRQGELGLWASSLGQEAAQVGSVRAMGPDDFAFPTFRDHGVTWCRGVSPLEMLAMFRGVSTGGWDPFEKGCGPYSIVIGSQALHGVGYAMGITLDNSMDTVIAYFGDGATDQGDVNEAFIFASVFNAPVIFFCQNNQWAISKPRQHPTRSPIHERARGFDFPGILVDGNDVLAVMAVTRAARERSRAGLGPTLIEAYTYRMGAHTTSDDPTRYRHETEVETWRLRDPIQRLKVYLSRHGFADSGYFDGITAEGEELAKSLRTGVRSMVVPEPDSMFDDVYADPNSNLDKQRSQMLAYLGSFADGLMESPLA